MKYNFILRGAWEEYSNDFIRFYVSSKCRGNNYPTTLLYLCLGINKLSRITKAQKVYRAPGGRLPKQFFEDSDDGTRGGVELGFMSTTTDKHEAMKYAMYSGAPVIFEVQQGMVAKGADISWLSQFPSEAEVLFGPLTVCEVYRIRQEGAFSVVELRPSISSGAQRNQMEMQADERMSDMLKMICSDPSHLESISAQVDEALGRTTAEPSGGVSAGALTDPEAGGATAQAEVAGPAAAPVGVAAAPATAVPAPAPVADAPAPVEGAPAPVAGALIGPESPDGDEATKLGRAEQNHEATALMTASFTTLGGSVDLPQPNQHRV